MKRIICIIFVSALVLSQFTANSFAATDCDYDNRSTVILRAGGGGSSGGSGGGSSGGDSGTSHHVSDGGRGTLLEQILSYIMLPFVLCFSSILFFIQLTKRYFRSRKLMKQISKSDDAWKYKDLESTVTDSFYAIQEAWSALDMSPASGYMSEKLYERFQSKLGWMKYKHQKNVLENITLLQALPVAVHDDPDDSRDYIWFYIKGRMIDYTIDTDTQSKVDGSTRPASFVEYWQFIRKENTWVLNEILQKDEADQIPFDD